VRNILNVLRKKNGYIEACPLDVEQLNCRKPVNMAYYWVGTILVGAVVGISRADNQFPGNMQSTGEASSRWKPLRKVGRGSKAE
jgi:hypothetical protein